MGDAGSWEQVSTSRGVVSGGWEALGALCPPGAGTLAGWEVRVGLCPSTIRVFFFLLPFQTPLLACPGVDSLPGNLPSRDQAWWQHLALIIHR